MTDDLDVAPVCEDAVAVNSTRATSPNGFGTILEEVMARSKRRGRSARVGRPSRYADGSAIPSELLALVPPTAPVSYMGGREHVRSLALQIFAEMPELEHAVMMTDVLGGVHRVRCFEKGRGLRLSAVADLVVMEAEDLPFAVHLMYLSRGSTVPDDIATLWSTMRSLHHPEPPHLIDVLIVNSEDKRVSSLAELFGGWACRPENN
jgi:hypothetical protein